MATEHGSTAILKLNDGSLRDMSAYVTETGWNRLRDMHDITTIGVASGTQGMKSYIPGLGDGTIPLEGNYDPTVDGYLNTLYTENTTARAWEYYPADDATGDVKYSGTGWLSKYDIKTGTSDAGRISAEWQNSGAVSRATV